MSRSELHCNNRGCFTYCVILYACCHTGLETLIGVTLRSFKFITQSMCQKWVKIRNLVDILTLESLRSYAAIVGIRVNIGHY